MLLSIVVPVYFNAENLEQSVPRLLKIKERIAEFDLELVFVDDGSKDRSHEILEAFHHQFPETITVIKLTRNFGEMSAILAGIQAAKGDCVVSIGADLQDPPELIPEMIQHWRAGYRTVLAIRQGRNDAFFTNMLADSFYFLFRRLAMPEFPRQGFDFFLIDRSVVDRLLQMSELNSNLMAQIYWLQDRVITISYERKQRLVGKSQWSLSKRIAFACDSFVAFSALPFRLSWVTGVVLFFFGSAFLLGTIYTWLEKQQQPSFVVGLIIALTIIMGTQLTLFGIMGEYLWRTLEYARSRPRYIVEKISKRKEDELAFRNGEIQFSPQMSTTAPSIS